MSAKARSSPWRSIATRRPSAGAPAGRRGVQTTVLVVRFDVLDGIVSWEAPLIINNVRQ
jgi:hypothetical protein